MPIFPLLMFIALCIPIMSLGGATSQTGPTTDKEFGPALSGVNGFFGAAYKNRDNPTSPQAFKDYAKGAAGYALKKGMENVAKDAITKDIIYKGAEKYVAAREAGDIAGAEAIKATTFSEVGAAGTAFSIGVFIAAVVVGLFYPNHTDPDPCDIDPSKCRPNQSPESPPTVVRQEASPTDNSKSNTQAAAGTSNGKTSPSLGFDSEKSDLGGINFTSIKLNHISINEKSSGGIDFDLALKADKADGTSPVIDPINNSLTSAIAFMTGLAVPDNKFWVNLKPSSPDRIIDEQLAQSEVGRIMLEADLQMKKDIKHYDNPCANKTGKALWDLLEKKREVLAQRCMEKFPGEIENINNVWFSPVTRFDIVPDKVYAYTNGTQIYIINATLSIESEPENEDTFFKVTNQDARYLSKSCLEELNKSAKELGQYAEELEYRMILPYVIADINHGEKYEDLREVYVALALAQWYKSRITPHMDIFRKSLGSSGPTVIKSLTPWSPKEIWERYICSYKNGEYKCWENTTTGSSFHQAGGVSFKSIRDHMIEIEGMPPEVQDRMNRAITNGYVDEETDVLFGNRLHVAAKDDALTTGSKAGSSQKPAKQKEKAESGLTENRTDNGIRLPNETASGQNNTASSKSVASGSASKVTCPDGWMGPDEKGECWRMQITGKS